MYSPLAQFDVVSVLGEVEYGMIDINIDYWVNDFGLEYRGQDMTPYLQMIQFWLNFWISMSHFVNNYTLTLLLVLFLIFGYVYVVGNLCYLLPKRYNYVSESIFLFIYEMVQTKIGKGGLKYYPFILSIFFFILGLNLESLMPYSFAITTHIIWTLTFTLSVLSGLLLLGVWRHGLGFINLFIPEVPKFLYPLIIPLEILSYIIRGFSLAIRLSANVLAGHTLTHIISDTVKMLGMVNFDLAIISLVLLIGITVMEMGVACLQAYIFTLLIVIYINDVYNLAH